jgi:hypothetical protein
LVGWVAAICLCRNCQRSRLRQPSTTFHLNRASVRRNVSKADAQLSFGSRFLNSLSFAFHFDISDYILKGDRAVCCGGGLAPPGALDVRSGVARMDWLTPV